MTIDKRYIYITAAAIMAILTVGCAGVEDPEPQEWEGANYILFDMQPKSDIDVLAEYRSRAQGEDDPTKVILPVIPESVGVFCYNNRAATAASVNAGEVLVNEQFFYGQGETYKTMDPQSDNPYNWDLESNLWPYGNPRTWISTFTDTDPTLYKFFVYAPYDADNVRVVRQSYENLHLFEWDNIPRYSGESILVSDKLISYRSVEPGQQNGARPVHMNQLQSRVRFLFNLGPTYSDLRKIRIKSMRVTDLQGFTLKLAVNFDEKGVESDGTINYESRYTWSSGSKNTPRDVDLINEAEVHELGYIELSAENRTEADGVTPHYQALASLYVFPYDNLRAVNVEVTYDVYDLAGQLLRESETVKNTVFLNLSASGSPEDDAHPHVLKPGYYYDVKLRIEPNYLYVLSDNDFVGEDEIGDHLVIKE